MSEIFTWCPALLLAALLGWFCKRLFGPTVDAMGSVVLDQMSLIVNKKHIAKKAYLNLKEIMEKNHTENGYTAFCERKTYLRDQKIEFFFSTYGSMMRRAIKNVWIRESRIDSYSESDVFFAGMKLLLKEINKKDIQLVFEMYKDSNQAALWPFLEFIDERKPKILSVEVVNFLRLKQEEWKKKFKNKK